MLFANPYRALLPINPSGSCDVPVVVPKPLPYRPVSRRCFSPFQLPHTGPGPAPALLPVASGPSKEIDPLYLFGCYMEWERHEDPSAGWELVTAAHSLNSDTRAHACALLANSRHLGGMGSTSHEPTLSRKRQDALEAEMKAPYGLEIVENCTACPGIDAGYFCGFPPHILHALDQVSHKSVLPAGAILFVEGQPSRACSSFAPGR